MNDNKNDDQFRFNKLYQLLGDEVNQIYDDKSNNVFLNEKNTTNNQEQKEDIAIFSDNENIFEEDALLNDNEVISHVEVPINDVFNIFNNNPNNSAYYQELNAPVNNQVSDDSLDVNIPNTEDKLTDDVNDDNGDNDSKEITNNILFQPIKIDNIEEVPKPVSSNVDGQILNKNEFRNKTLVETHEFNDGLDGIDDGKRSFINILTGKNTILILAIIALAVVAVLTFKIFYFGKVVDIYNEYTTETDKEGSNTTNIYGGDEIDSETLKKAAATELIECINAPVNTNDLPENIKAIINEINTYYNKSNTYYAFAYKDLFTGFTVTYNEEGNIFAASTIKAPVNIYLYEKASEGEIDLDKELTYTSKYYTDGTGVLKNNQPNTKYTIRKLSEYAIRKSDNIAHNMLTDEFGRQNIKKFWQDKGTNIILTGNDNWGLINAHDSMIYMKELYTFYINNNEYGTELMDNFLNASTKFITSPNGYKVANKSGWSGFAQHDVAIVFAENPYIVVALSNLGYDNNYMSYFNKASNLANNLHQEYWKYKMSKCSNIKQYN